MLNNLKTFYNALKLKFADKGEVYSKDETYSKEEVGAIETEINGTVNETRDYVDSRFNDLATVASSGRYTDLNDKPTIYTDVVRYNAVQTLSEKQQEIVKDNINAVGKGEALVIDEKDGSAETLPRMHINNTNINVYNAQGTQTLDMSSRCALTRKLKDDIETAIISPCTDSMIYSSIAGGRIYLKIPPQKKGTFGGVRVLDRYGNFMEFGFDEQERSVCKSSKDKMYIFGQIKSVHAPEDDTDAVNKQYVDENFATKDELISEEAIRNLIKEELEKIQSNTTE